jgi:hypothetical protein
LDGVENRIIEVSGKIEKKKSENILNKLNGNMTIEGSFYLDLNFSRYN